MPVSNNFYYDSDRLHIRNTLLAEEDSSNGIIYGRCW